MEATAPPQTSIFGLIRSLRNDAKNLLRQEIQLAKAELSEKVALFGRNAVAVAVGGFIAYAGLIVLLMGLGWLVAWGLQKAGLEPVLAGFLGLAIIGLLVAGAGTAFLLTGLKAFSKESLAPDKTLDTIKRLKKSEAHAAPAPPPQPKRSSDEIKVRVEQTEDRMTGALDELGQRLHPRNLNSHVKYRIAHKPYHSGVLAMAAGLISGLFLTRAARRT